MNYQHILLAVELANRNPIIEERALNLQKSMQAKLTIISVVEYLPSDSMDAEMGILSQALESEQVMMEHAQLEFDRIADRLNIPGKNRILKNGRAGNKIVETANDIDADLIIVGSHGKRGLQLLLGSTANAVLHHTGCDVLAVRLQKDN